MGNPSISRCAERMRTDKSRHRLKTLIRNNSVSVLFFFFGGGGGGGLFVPLFFRFEQHFDKWMPFLPWMPFFILSKGYLKITAMVLGPGDQPPVRIV